MINMTIYIDNDFKCHVDGKGMRAVETDFFDGRCKEFIEGYRFVPFGEKWRREDGEVFNGEMIAPWKDSEMLTECQSAAERVRREADEELIALLDIIERMDMGE